MYQVMLLKDQKIGNIRKMMFFTIVFSMILFPWGIASAYHFSILNESYNCSASMNLINLFQDTDVYSASIYKTDIFNYSAGSSSYIVKNNTDNKLDYSVGAGASGYGYFDDGVEMTAFAQSAVSFIIVKDNQDINTTIAVAFSAENLTGGYSYTGSPSFLIKLDKKVIPFTYHSDYDIGSGQSWESAYTSISLYLNTDQEYVLDFFMSQSLSIYGATCGHDNLEMGDFSLTVASELPPSVPLPSAFLLLGSGLGCLAIYRRIQMNTRK